MDKFAVNEQIEKRVCAVESSKSFRPSTTTHHSVLSQIWIAMLAFVTACAHSGIAPGPPPSSSSASSSPASLSWAAVGVGGRGEQQVVTLTNPGTTTINISSIAFGGANPADFCRVKQDLRRNASARRQLYRKYRLWSNGDRYQDCHSQLQRFGPQQPPDGGADQ
jgi:hypothetical protein